MSNYLMPPVETELSGQSRRAGFEFEFGNLPVIETARELQSALGGELDSKSPFEVVLEDSELGRLKIERDVKKIAKFTLEEWVNEGSFRRDVDRVEYAINDEPG